MKLNLAILEPFEALTIGSYNEDNMNGHMDEILVFSEALDAERVRRLRELQL